MPRDDLKLHKISKGKKLRSQTTLVETCFKWYHYEQRKIGKKKHALKDKINVLGTKPK